jgi:RNA polymerase sigma-70 factor (ECF subfamily)
MTASLADSFLQHAPPAEGSATDARARLERALATDLARAAAAWPGVVVGAEELAAWIAERTPDQVDPAEAIASMNVVDLHLACACARGDRAALAAFEARVMPAIARAIVRIDASTSFLREVEEELRIKLFVGEPGRGPRIAAYLGRGPITSWAQVAAIRTAYSLKRAEQRDHAMLDADDEALLGVEDDGASADPERAVLRAERRRLLGDALSESLAALATRERAVLRLYLLEDVGSETIAKMYGVHRGTVARWIAAAYESVLAGVKKRLSREAGLRPAEIESLLRVAGSQLSFRMSVLLSTAPG